MEFVLNISGRPFNLDYTLQSGQVFRWKKVGTEWEGIVSSTVLRIRQEGEFLFCKSSKERIGRKFVIDYFRLNDDLASILASISKDETIKRAISHFYGLRLIKQEPWECLVSFVLSTNSNIPKIIKMVESLCSLLGKKFYFEGKEYFSFPSAEEIFLYQEELDKAKLGYRKEYLISVSQAILSKSFNLDTLQNYNYEEAKKIVLSKTDGKKLLTGVGNKVADCLLLFAFQKDESFPIDTWILKVVKKYYPVFFSGLKINDLKITEKQYQIISKRLRDYFGKYSGYAQQYLYMLSRFES